MYIVISKFVLVIFENLRIGFLFNVNINLLCIYFSYKYRGNRIVLI